MLIRLVASYTGQATGDVRILNMYLKFKSRPEARPPHKRLRPLHSTAQPYISKP